MSTPAPRLAAEVGARLRAAFPGQEPAPLRELPGGHSGITYRTTVGDTELVVKAAPPGRPALGRHDMLRQARVLRALEPTGLPVPRVVAQGEGEVAWFAMSFVPGDSTEPVLDDGPLLPAVAAARMRSAAALMARFHELEPRSLGIDDAALTPGSELDRWDRMMSAVPSELVPGGSAMCDQLRAGVPEGGLATFVHGDFRLGNMLSVGAEPQALIDWEIWSVGDPRVEMGWFVLFNDHENFPGVGKPVPGLPSTEELIEIYGEHGGHVRDLEWFLLLGRFKMAMIMAHNLRRHREGRHEDPDQELLPATIEHLLRDGPVALR